MEESPALASDEQSVLEEPKQEPSQEDAPSSDISATDDNKGDTLSEECPPSEEQAAESKGDVTVGDSPAPPSEEPVLEEAPTETEEYVYYYRVFTASQSYEKLTFLSFAAQRSRSLRLSKTAQVAKKYQILSLKASLKKALSSLSKN